MPSIWHNKLSQAKRFDILLVSIGFVGLAFWSSPGHASLSVIPATVPATVPPPSSIAGSVAGTNSASSSRAPFVPQQAPKYGEAEPILQVAIPLPTALTRPSTQQTIASTNKLWQSLLHTYTMKDPSGLVCFDYAALKKSPEDMARLANYIAKMQAFKPSRFSRDEALAYWANLYNALTVQIVAKNYPVKSIRQIKSGLFHPGPWRRKLVKVEGRELSLDDIEHGIMRPKFKTPFIHYMVNCASISCPNLKTTPWTAAHLQEDLQKSARNYINSPRGVIIEDGKVQVSSIYKWYAGDFGGPSHIVQYLQKYANADLRQKLDAHPKIDQYHYNWGLNTP